MSSEWNGHGRFLRLNTASDEMFLGRGERVLPRRPPGDVRQRIERAGGGRQS